MNIVQTLTGRFHPVIEGLTVSMWQERYIPLGRQHGSASAGVIDSIPHFPFLRN